MEPAKPDYKQRLAVHAAEDLRRESSAALQILESPEQTAGPSDESQRSAPFHLPSRDGRKVIDL